MKRLIYVIAVLLVSASSFAADEPDNRTPLERYRGDGQVSILMCNISLRLALSRAELGAAQDEQSDYVGCIEREKGKSKQNLAKALRTVKKVKAQEALKSFHVSLVTALDGIRPGINERKINYEQRQQALEGKITEAWARFEVEQ
jgi:hypothetical protein